MRIATAVSAAAALVLSSGLVWHSSYAGFSDATTPWAAGVTTGTLALTDDAVLDLPGLGLPVLWTREGRTLRLAAGARGLAALSHSRWPPFTRGRVRGRRTPTPPVRPGRRPRGRPGPGRPARHAARHLRDQCHFTDRHVYMTDAGQLASGVYSNGV